MRRPIRRAGAVAAGAAVLLILSCGRLMGAPGEIAATVETDPVPSGDDAADDPAIWIHPTDPRLSVVIGTDKQGGLAVYDLEGTELQYDGSVVPNNVDLRYGFPLGGEDVTLIGFSDLDGGTIGVYTIDPGSRRVRDISAGEIEPSIFPSGFCLYRSSATGRFYAFVVGGSDRGEVEQWVLRDDGSGGVEGNRVRSFRIGGESEGCVADDRHGDVYVSEQGGGIWKYGAEPGDGNRRTLVDGIGGDGDLTEDVEGLAIYATSGGGGYLIASSQGSDTFVLYDRRTGDHVGSFRIAEGALDEVTHTDGIDVTNFALGPAFRSGLFVAQDDENPGGNQNFKLVRWGRIARAFSPALTIDTAFDPRVDPGDEGPLGAS